MTPFKCVHQSAHSAIQIAVTWDESATLREVTKALTESWATAMAEVDKRFNQ